MTNQITLKRAVLAGAGMATLLCAPAAAQMPSMNASFSGESIMTTPDGTMSARLYGVPGKLRTDMYVQGMSTVNVMDMNAEEVMSWSPDPNSGMGRTAMKMNYAKVAKQYGVDTDQAQRATRTGRDRVAGHDCTVYTHEGMSACVTYDGIILRSESPRDGYKSEMTTMTRGPQPASYFQVPAGYSVMDPTDFGSMMGSMGGHDGGAYGNGSREGGSYGTTTSTQSGGYDSSLEDRLAREAERETNRRVDDAVSDRAGGLVGDIMGDEAGSIVGGLFGKKKKKKKRD